MNRTPDNTTATGTQADGAAPRPYLMHARKADSSFPTMEAVTDWFENQFCFFHDRVTAHPLDRILPTAAQRVIALRDERTEARYYPRLNIAIRTWEMLRQQFEQERTAHSHQLEQLHKEVVEAEARHGRSEDRCNKVASDSQAVIEKLAEQISDLEKAAAKRDAQIVNLREQLRRRKARK